MEGWGRGLLLKPTLLLIIHQLSFTLLQLSLPEYLFSRNQSRHAYIMLLGFPWGVCVCEILLRPCNTPGALRLQNDCKQQHDNRQHDLGHWQWNNLCSQEEISLLPPGGHMQIILLCVMFITVYYQTNVQQSDISKIQLHIQSRYKIPEITMKHTDYCFQRIL